jgi:hypothetical protein
LFSILAAVAATLVPLTAKAQVNPEARPGSGASAPGLKYEAYAGFAYSRLRQVSASESYSGLLGGKVSLARDWGKYFQLLASGDYYSVGTGRTYLPSPGHPTIYTFLLGPALHATLYGNLSGLVFAQVGGEHTGGEDITPSISFAGGFGGGIAYNFSRNLGVQLTGDRVGASFSLPNNTAQLANSTHRTWNARGTIGVVYRF